MLVAYFLNENLCFVSVPELIFWHIPSKAYAVVAPWWAIWNPCVGSINKEKVTPQDSEEGMMELLEKRPSVKVRPLLSMIILLVFW